MGVRDRALSMRQSVLQLSLVRHSVIVVINGAETCPLVVTVVPDVSVSHFASVLA